jgi:hypothetical protein
MIAELKNNYGENINDKHIGIGTIQHYPNRGFMSEHYDPKFPQKVVVSVILEDDFLKGGLAIKLKKNFINIDDYLKKGDVVIHPLNILHKVEEVSTKSKNYLQVDGEQHPYCCPYKNKKIYYKFLINIFKKYLPNNNYKIVLNH